MGKLIWCEWGRLIALTSGCWTMWGGLWGLIYRKYMWDFVDGQLGPAGIIPGPSAAPFLALVVEMPVIQGLCMLCGLLTISFEWPFFPQSFVYRSLIFKLTFYIHAGVVSSLIYQSVDAAVFYFLVVCIYLVALRKGEVVGQGPLQAERV